MVSFFRRLFGRQVETAQLSGRVEASVPTPTEPPTQPEPSHAAPDIKNFRLRKLDSHSQRSDAKAYGFEVVAVKDSRTSSVSGLAFTVTSLVSPSQAELRDAGIYIFKIVGVTHRAEALQHKAFKPGSVLTLVIENDNPHDPNAVSIWDERQTRMVGYVPREDNQAVRTMLRLHPEYQVISLREYRKSRKRVGLLALFGQPTLTREQEA